MVRSTFFLLLVCGLTPTTARGCAVGISEPYWNPAEYPKTVMRIIHKPLSTPGEASRDIDSFQLSETIPSSDFKGAQSNGDIAYAESLITPWQSSHCDDPVMNYPRWEGFPVKLCEYSDIGVTVKTYMLNANRAKQARWIVTACKDAHALQMKKCTDYLVGEVRTASSGGVFPIAGYIPEPQFGGVCYVFRDGVTVLTEFLRDWLRPKNKACGNSYDEQMTAPLYQAWRYARIASTTRKDYQDAGGIKEVGEDCVSHNASPGTKCDLRWVDVVRELYQEAWNSDRNQLISAKAKAGKARGAFK